MFYADLHVHSRFSRATSADCRLDELARWAWRKGLRVIGTGDFTHPEWRAQIAEQLQPAEPGLFRLPSAAESRVASNLLATPERNGVWREAEPPRFVLQTEVATLFRRDGRTRKVHHVILVPDLPAAARLSARLERIGNLHSDGRPILGMDSRDLLAMALEASESALVIPAHIWTPWFSALGANSGFDSIAECYGDLAGHIHAVETGLSSDPPMNWRLSALDRYRLVSNSDAHSPAKLGREATGFDCAPDYRAMHRALRTGHGFGGTIEFFPEEGKYHLDGHRNCAVCLSPDETRRRGGLCPVCGKPLTVGVLNRVTALADRPKGERPARAAPFLSLVPLAEVLGETLGVGPASRKVARAYEAALAAIGPELDILARAPLADISRLVSPALAAAIRHMREGRVLREPGYDGKYGKIRLLAR